MNLVKPTFFNIFVRLSRQNNKYKNEYKSNVICFLDGLAIAFAIK